MLVAFSRNDGKFSVGQGLGHVPRLPAKKIYRRCPLAKISDAKESGPMSWQKSSGKKILSPTPINKNDGKITTLIGYTKTCFKRPTRKTQYAKLAALQQQPAAAPALLDSPLASPTRSNMMVC
jgi:hypothetical protein